MALNNTLLTELLISDLLRQNSEMSASLANLQGAIVKVLILDRIQAQVTHQALSTPDWVYWEIMKPIADHRIRPLGLV